jgi:hypothetical protein
MKNPLSTTRDVADSRDVIEYKQHLEEQILNEYVEWVESHNDHCEEGQEIEVPESYEEIEFVDEEAFTETCPDLTREYEAIRDFCDECDGYGDFEHGETLIRRSYFQEYCEELCEEIGEIPKDLPSYIVNNIDWEGVADDLEVDYMTVDYDGQEFLMRA